MDQIICFVQELPPIAWNLLLITLSLVAGIMLRGMLHRVFAWTTKRTDYYLFKSIVKYLETPAVFFIPALILNFTSDWLVLPNPIVVTRIIEICLLFSFAWMLVGAVHVVEDQVYYKNDLSKSDNLKERKIRTQLEFISRLVIAMIVVLTLAAMLLSFENLRKIGTGLLASVGVGSIIIGFAAQSSLSNLLAGFQIAFTQPIRIDDVVVVEGEWGRIEDITLTYVVVKIWDNRRLVLPIRYFIEKPFQNWTRVTSEIVGTVMLYVDYTMPVDKIRKEFERLVLTSELWDKKTIALQVTDVKERTIELRALVSSRNAGDSFDLRCMIREKLIDFIQREHPDALPKVRNDLNQLPIAETLLSK